jgi:hypothetical protein
VSASYRHIIESAIHLQQNISCDSDHCASIKAEIHLHPDFSGWSVLLILEFREIDRWLADVTARQTVSDCRELRQ